MGAWQWVCEDDEEAFGLSTILERAGVAVEVRRDLGGTATLLGDEDAAALTSKILSRYARAHERQRAAALDRRRRYGGFALLGLLGVFVLAAVILLW